MNDELSDLLQSLSLHAQQLEALLLREAELLSETRSADALEQLAQEKMDLVQTLEQLELRRRQLAKGTDDSNQVIWQDTLTILKRCQEMNTQAGADITSQAHYGQRALEILGIGAHNTPIYSADGETHRIKGGHALGKA
jgi:flagellar biosynthesis/type III secretory pathway chaperone